MAHRLLRDPDADGWESQPFPIVCETCLGPNPYVRMQRMEYGGECHISGRPYTKFRWRPGNDARYKGTIICQEVAKAKNVCQVCLLDLDYNLPVQVRDQAMGIEDEALPESDVGREFALERMSNEEALGAAYALKGKPNDTIMKLQRTNPHYKRNLAPVCSFFVKGECKRGAECPYRHEMPTTGELATQNIKDRYYGVNDPVAKKMMNRVQTMTELVKPDDTTITTLYVGNVVPEISAEDISIEFAPFGDIESVRKIEGRDFAFVTFKERADAEEAASKLHNRLIVKGQRLKLMWGKTQERPEGSAAPSQMRPGPVPAIMVPPQVQRQLGQPPPERHSAAPHLFSVPAAIRSTPTAYASMDPQQQGSRAADDGSKRKSDAEPGPDAKRRSVGGPPMGPPPGQPGGPPSGPGPFVRPQPGQYAPPGPSAYRPMGPPQGMPMQGPPRGMPLGPMRPPPIQMGGRGPPPGWGVPPGQFRPPAGRPAQA